jgi:hypothetical protein
VVIPSIVSEKVKFSSDSGGVALLVKILTHINQ